MKLKMNPVVKKLTLLTGAMLSAGLLAGCGGDEKKTETAAPQSQSAATAEAATNVVQITGNDQMQFSLKAFEVQSGQEVTLTMTNVGTMPKQAMGHNLVILQPGASVSDFGTKAMSAVETEYIPTGSENLILAHTKLLGPGESDTITFTAPTPGEYPFLCSFPGHFGVMQGVMTVK